MISVPTANVLLKPLLINRCNLLNRIFTKQSSFEKFQKSKCFHRHYSNFSLAINL